MAVTLANKKLQLDYESSWHIFQIQIRNSLMTSAPVSALEGCRIRSNWRTTNASSPMAAIYSSTSWVLIFAIAKIRWQMQGNLIDHGQSEEAGVLFEPWPFNIQKFQLNAKIPHIFSKDTLTWFKVMTCPPPLSQTSEWHLHRMIHQTRRANQVDTCIDTCVDRCIIDTSSKLTIINLLKFACV